MAARVLPKILSADTLGDLLVQVIHGVAGGTEAGWRKVVGPVERMPTWVMVSHNWRVKPKGTAAQRRTVESGRRDCPSRASLRRIDDRFRAVRER